MSSSKPRTKKQKKYHIVNRIFSFDSNRTLENDRLIRKIGYVSLIPSTNIEGTRYVSFINIDFHIIFENHPLNSNVQLDRYLYLPTCFYSLLYVNRSGQDPNTFDPINPAVISGLSSSSVPIGYPQDDIISFDVIPFSLDNFLNGLQSSGPTFTSGYINAFVQSKSKNIFYNGRVNIASGQELLFFLYANGNTQFDDQSNNNIARYIAQGVFSCAISF